MIEKDIIENAINSLKNNSDNERFINFLDNMNIDEKLAYLYIEAQRSNVFLQELSSMQGQAITIEDLKDEKIRKKFKHLLHNKIYVQNLINFWDSFGKIDKPPLEIRNSIISKHNLYYKQLSENEKEFFINC